MGRSEEDFERLKEAHRRLIAAYTELHLAVASKWFLRPAVDEHLRRGLRLLANNYVHVSKTRFDSDAQRAWLEGEVAQLKELEETFDRRWIPHGFSGPVRSIGTPALNAALLFSGLSGIGLAVSGYCLCNILWLGPLIATGLVLTIGIEGFDEKRSLFVEKRIYEAEDEVYDALGIAKPRELPLWGIAFAILSAIWLAAAAVQAIAIDHHLFVRSHQERHWFVFAAMAIATVAILVYSSRREPA
jgi:hypothetical protein